MAGQPGEIIRKAATSRRETPRLCELGGLPAGALNIAHEAVDRHVLRGHGHRVAIRWLPRKGAPREITYDELRRLTNRFAHVLREGCGLRKGDRLFVLCDRSPEHFVGVLGALKAGLVACPLFSAFGPEPVRRRMELGRPNAILTTEASFRRKVEPAASWIPSLRHILIAGESLGVLMAEAPDEFACEPTRPEDGAFLHFTSGTTGVPKAALHVHGAAVTYLGTAVHALDLHAGDVYWCTADPGWVTGTSYGLVAPLLHGARSVVDEADFEAARCYHVLDSEGVSVWYTTPTAIRTLMKSGAPARRPPQLRFAACVGEPLEAPAVWWSQEALGLPVHDNWLQTETGGIMIANTPAMDIRPGSMGKPLPGVEAFVVQRVDGNGVRVVEATEARGELALKAGWPSMFRGYLGADERYRKCFSDGLYLTGDLVRRDADGYYWFEARADEAINSAGQLIGPMEVESALMEHPAVAEAGVIGKPDAVYGEAVKAFVALKVGFRASEPLRLELIAHARRRLGAALAPREIAFAAGLPKDRSGKVVRRLLKARELGVPEDDASTLETP